MSSTLKVFVHSRRGLGIAAHRARFARDLEQDPAPYGFDAAARAGVDIDFSEDGPYPRWSERAIMRLGMDPLHALYNLRALRRADVIWTVLEWEWLAVSLLQRLGLLRAVPVIGNSVWLFDHWPGWRARRRRFLRWLMADNIYLTLHARGALERSVQYVPDRRFRISLFGVSTRAFAVTPVVARASDRPIRIYSIGNDGTRDWQTLLEAFGGDARFEVVVVCAWIAARHDTGRFANVRVPRDVTVSDQRGWYDWADVVVVPMHENSYSGITVACEAAARGVAVVCARTGGVPTYFAEDEVAYVPPGDAVALREAVLARTPDMMAGMAGRAQARFSRDGYGSGDMVERYLTISRRLVAR